MNLIEQARLAKKASAQVRILTSEQKNKVLRDFADGLVSQASYVISENDKDMEAARAAGMSTAMLDRLMLNEKRISDMADGIRMLADLEDPIGKVLEERTLKSGLQLKKVTCPIGVIGIIFESRPNVTADCAALCFKSGNACVLKGGKESYLSCLAVTSVMKEALKNNGITEDAVMLAERPSHEETQRFMECREYVDLLIPRGGKKLIQAVLKNAKIPAIETGAGVCHVFVDESADLDMAEKIIVNAKCSRPSVCNAMETLLVHASAADTFIPRIVKTLQEKDVVIYGDEKARALCPSLKEAEEASWSTEYDDLIMNLKVVGSVQEAAAHIEQYGTHHSESIITENDENVLIFMNSIDSACLYHNASTRFTDGFEFGLGAEIGISTQKLHARGPMGLQELTSYCYRLEGKGEIR
ncbi:MAG: glutamate-5-semialdehyde dehydrogenase [Solobacterium sp.]|nr:glutamate-5-semialdehyde dehydrogenase [Solobacterium sp.]